MLENPCCLKIGSSFAAQNYLTMKIKITTILLLVKYAAIAQVGIGTTNPTAELEINTSNSTIPPLELNPQIAPVGSNSGQLAVIGDQLYLYDLIRNKWLTIETSTFTFGREGNLDGHDLEYAGDITDSGPSLLNDGTIVYIALNSSGGNPSKGIILDIYNSSDALVSSQTLNLSSGKLTKSDINIDFVAGDYFRVRVVNDTGSIGSVKDVSAVLWTKWRKDN